VPTGILAIILLSQQKYLRKIDLDRLHVDSEQFTHCRDYSYRS